MNTSNPSSSKGQMGRRRVKFSWLWVGATILICSFWSFRRISTNSLSTMFSVAYEGGGFLQTIQRSQYNLPPVNVAFGLSGNHPGFLAEFEVALKSVLLNAPMERNLYTHVLADKDAFGSLDEIFNRTLLPTWVTRNPIEIHAYDISSHLPWLKQTIHDTFSTALNRKKFNVNEATDRHTIGCFYRLMVHRIIPPFVKHVLYLDTDVVVFANEEDLWQQVESKPDALFHWGQNMCSGFVVMNVPRMAELWSLAKSITNMTDISKERGQDINDQLLYLALNVTYPEEVNVLSDGWDMTVAAIWQREHWPYNESRPNVGMLHFNGGSSSKHSYFRGHSFLVTKFNDTWGNAIYYVNMPWTWSRFQAKSVIRPGTEGCTIRISMWGDRIPPWSSVMSNETVTSNSTKQK